MPCMLHVLWHVRSSTLHTNVTGVVCCVLLHVQICSITDQPVKAQYTNSGACVDLFAPGTEVRACARSSTLCMEQRSTLLTRRFLAGSVGVRRRA